MNEELGIDKNINLNRIEGKNLSYLYHAISITAAYLIPVTIGTIFFIPFAGPYAVMLPMMIFMHSWKVFVFLLIMLPVCRKIIEDNLFAAYFVCTLISYISFYHFNPHIAGSFLGINYDLGQVAWGRMFKSALFILGFPLLYCTITFGIYIQLLKRGINKRNKKQPTPIEHDRHRDVFKISEETDK